MSWRNSYLVGKVQYNIAVLTDFLKSTGTLRMDIKVQGKFAKDKINFKMLQSHIIQPGVVVKSWLSFIISRAEYSWLTFIISGAE